MYVLLLFVFLLAKSFCLKDYYWRDYTGKIPEDAFPGGHDTNDEKTYIGMVFLSNAGVFPATIYPESKKVYAYADSIRESENYVQLGSYHKIHHFLNPLLGRFNALNKITLKKSSELLTYGAPAILCTKLPGNMKWIPVNKTDFHFNTMNKHLIRGGVQDKNWLHIGRINYQGEVVIGKALSGRAGLNDAYMTFIQNDSQNDAYSYEVLTFVNTGDLNPDAETLAA